MKSLPKQAEKTKRYDSENKKHYYLQREKTNETVFLFLATFFVECKRQHSVSELTVWPEKEILLCQLLSHCFAHIFSFLFRFDFFFHLVFFCLFRDYGSLFVRIFYLILFILYVLLLNVFCVLYVYNAITYFVVHNCTIVL